uniref:Piwi domain-containing protein n=1 Tax=Angiostrongylus cantonensis TaxID=6313 RepID=A0A0K0DH84_ANGCA
MKASGTLPQQRLNETKVMKNALGIASGNPFLERAGINVEKEFTKVTGRILTPPVIVYGRSEEATVNNCKWIWDRAQFLQPAKLLNWAVCVTLTQGDLQRVPVKNYIERMENRCRSHGMEVATVSEVFYLKRQNYDGVEEWYEAQMKKSRTYLMFITSDNIHLHDTIKLLELQYQIVSQEIRAGKVVAVVSKNQNQTLDNVVAKVNHKFGGINYNIVLDLAPKYKSWLSDSSIVFIGFEISNPPALSKFEIERGATYKMPSVLGWGANCTGNPQQFIGDHTYVEARQSDVGSCIYIYMYITYIYLYVADSYIRNGIADDGLEIGRACQ